MRLIDRSGYLDALTARSFSYHANYYAMYSSLLGGVVTDPVLMQLPIDDHLVHRGDGVFDTCKCVDGAVYNLAAHLDRLIRSAGAIGIRWPGGVAEIRALALETTRVAGGRDCCVRIILARGPGSFGVSPNESPASTLYIVVYALGKPFMTRHPAGASVRRSHVPAKPAQYAGVKNCNYLPNVLMKAESEAWGVDFVVGYDAAGFLTEGATENAGIVTRAGELAFPRLENILAGTTMLRLVDLAGDLLAAGVLKSVAYRDITEDELRTAAEVLIVGTTLNVVAVTAYDGQPIGDGRPGPVYAALARALEDDIRDNPSIRTVVPVST